jgi:hypothetical protein
MPSAVLGAVAVLGVPGMIPLDVLALDDQAQALAFAEAGSRWPDLDLQRDLLPRYAAREFLLPLRRDAAHQNAFCVFWQSG